MPSPKAPLQFALAVTAGLGATIALPAQAKVFDPTTFTLDNGMQVVVVENHRAPVVSHMVWYKVGAADEPAGKTGIAHVLEHLMFKGTDELAPGEFSKIVAREGGRDNAFTSSDYTGYFQNVAKDKLGLVMKMEADRMTDLQLDEQNVLTERAVVLEERSSRTDNNPSALLWEQMDAALYLNHPYGNPIIGWESEVSALTQQDALDFYQRWYAPNNAILVVAGDVTPEAVRKLAETHYGDIPREPNTPQRVRLAEPKHVAARRVEVRDARVHQPSWSRVYLAPSYSSGETQHAYALQVLAEMLGGSSTSRLYRALVMDHKLASSAGAWYDPSALDLTTFGVSATPRQGIDMAELEQAMEAELTKVAENGLTADEIDRAKTRLKAGAVFARDSLHTGARVLGEALTTGSTVEDVEAWPDRIAAVTPEQVAAAARAVLDARQSVTGLLLSDKTS